MRSYIFTEIEKQAIAKLFKRTLTESDRNVAKIKHRMKRYAQLERDIILYNKLKDRFKQSSSTQ